MRTLWITAMAAVLLASGASAADLKTVSRTIAREPHYVTKQPRYCLLVFGPQAAARVWLVVDGDYLFIDRNGDGDLTEPGKRARFAAFEEADGAFAEQREAEAGTVFAGKLKHERLVVRQQRVRKNFVAKERWEEELQAAVGRSGDTLVYQVRLSVEIRPRPGDPIPIAGRITQSTGTDDAGFLQFADRPENAPVVHFGDALRMGLYRPQRLRLSADAADLVTVVGTPGLGKGTFAAVSYDGLITDGAAPVADIEFPTAPGAPPVRARYTLPHRC